MQAASLDQKMLSLVSPPVLSSVGLFPDCANRQRMVTQSYNANRLTINTTHYTLLVDLPVPSLDMLEPVLQNRHQLRSMPHHERVDASLIQITVRADDGFEIRRPRIPVSTQLNRQHESTRVLERILRIRESVQVQSARNGFDCRIRKERIRLSRRASGTSPL